jgi:sugar phosphate isomerase/epimerase
VGVVLDVWHAWDDPRLLSDINRYTSRLIGVQVNDHREPTRSWADRVLPGDGTIDLPPIFRALDEGGFDGWYDLEIFSDDGRFGNAYPDSIATQDPEDVTRRGLAGFRRAWERRLGQTA